MNRTVRRLVAGVLFAFGVVLMLAAPDTRAGLAVLVLAVIIEVAGILLERRR
jgi:glucose uptake protein GlcU